jgi:hypothetical protein
MVEMDEDPDSALVWQHFSWIDARHQLEHHCIINKAFPPGCSVKWEWRYVHDRLKIQTQPLRYLPRTSKQDHTLRFLHGLLVPVGNSFNDSDKVSKHHFNTDTVGNLRLPYCSKAELSRIQAAWHDVIVVIGCSLIPGLSSSVVILC